MKNLLFISFVVSGWELLIIALSIIGLISAGVLLGFIIYKISNKN